MVLWQRMRGPNSGVAQGKFLCSRITPRLPLQLETTLLRCPWFSFLLWHSSVGVLLWCLMLLLRKEASDKMLWVWLWEAVSVCDCKPVPLTQTSLELLILRTVNQNVSRHVVACQLCLVLWLKITNSLISCRHTGSGADLCGTLRSSHGNTLCKKTTGVFLNLFFTVVFTLHIFSVILPGCLSGGVSCLAVCMCPLAYTASKPASDLWPLFKLAVSSALRPYNKVALLFFRLLFHAHSLVCHSAACREWGNGE